MAFSRGDFIKASDIGTGNSSFFARLEAVRQNHWSQPGQTGADPGAFTVEQVTVGSKITTSWLTTLKNYIAALANSSYVGGVNYGADLSLSGAISAEQFQAIDDVITTLENLPATDSAYHAGYNSSGYNSSNHSYDSSYNSSGYNSSGYNSSGYKSSVSSDFCVSFASSYSGECGAIGYS